MTTPRSRAALARIHGRLPETEATWQAVVVDYAHLKGWRVAHFRPAQTSDGWRTPVEADGRGFPDLVLTRERVIFAELKSGKGRLNADQVAWLEALIDARAEVYLWRPDDWETVKELLQ